MSFGRKILRAQMAHRSDVYGTEVINDGVTMSTREVSAYRDSECGEFDKMVFTSDCPQYAADAESTGVK